MNKTFANLIRRQPIFGAVEFLADRFQMALLRFYREPATVNLIEAAYRGAELRMRPFDVFALHELARMQLSVAGNMAEIGMYQGASARIICSLKGDKKFFGFDTFEGLPDVGRQDEKWLRMKQFKYKMSQEAVAAYLQDFPGVTLTKGLFPESGSVLNGERLSFVNLDVDLYKGTIDSLNFLWEKMNDRGLVLIHDTHLEGVKQAIGEFLAGHKAMAFGCGCMQTALIRVL